MAKLRSGETNAFYNDFMSYIKLYNENPELGNQIRLIFEKATKKNIDVETYKDLKHSLKLLTDENISDILLYLCRQNELIKIEELEQKFNLEEHGEPIRFLKNITILYGNDIQNAFIFESYLDYCSLYAVDLLYSPADKQWHMNVKLRKFIGENFFVNFIPNQCLSIITDLLEEMKALPKDNLDYDALKNINKILKDLSKKSTNKDSSEEMKVLPQERLNSDIIESKKIRVKSSGKKSAIVKK